MYNSVSLLSTVTLTSKNNYIICIFFFFNIKSYANIKKINMKKNQSISTSTLKVKKFSSEKKISLL